VRRWSGILALAVFAIAGCNAPPLGKIGDTFLAQAADTRELPKSADAESIELDDFNPKVLPKANEIRLAAGKQAPWKSVREATRSLEAAGKKVHLLTARRRIVGALELYETLEAAPIEVVSRTDGKSCVRLPGVREAKCVQRVDARHVDRAHLRQLVREAVRVSKIRDVAVHVPEDMEWADVVRTVDGARTCCKEHLRPRVTLVDIPADLSETASAPVVDP